MTYNARLERQATPNQNTDPPGRPRPLQIVIINTPTCPPQRHLAFANQFCLFICPPSATGNIPVLLESHSGSRHTLLGNPLPLKMVQAPKVTKVQEFHLWGFPKRVWEFPLLKIVLTQSLKSRSVSWRYPTPGSPFPLYQALGHSSA